MQHLANAMTARWQEVVFPVGFAGHVISDLTKRSKTKQFVRNQPMVLKNTTRQEIDHIYIINKS